MLQVNLGDQIILKPINMHGLVTSGNMIVYFKKWMGHSLLCSITYPDTNNANFLVDWYQIRTITDHITNEVIYQHDVADNL
jgi:hypothetical protein